MLKINHGFFVKPVFGLWYFFKKSRQRRCVRHRFLVQLYATKKSYQKSPTASLMGPTANFIGQNSKKNSKSALSQPCKG